MCANLITAGREIQTVAVSSGESRTFQIKHCEKNVSVF